jgi:hypothetical protein
MRERHNVPISAARPPAIRRKRRYIGTVMTTAPIRLIVLSATAAGARAPRVPGRSKVINQMYAGLV